LDFLKFDSGYLLTAFGKQEDDKPFSVQLSDESFETYEFDPPSYTMETTKRELKKMYYDMVTVR
jgi:pyruvate dehydrogenase E1 component alpha subunit